jgi:hypothetical protein
MRRALVVAISFAVAIAGSDAGARTFRLACRDGGACDLDDSCDGACLIRTCGNYTVGLRHCGRRSGKGLRGYASQIAAGTVVGECEKGICERYRCRRAARRCAPPSRACTVTVGPPFERQFACRVTLSRAEADPAGRLNVAVRDGTVAATGGIWIPRADAGHYTKSAGTYANISLPEPPGPYSQLHLVVDEFSAGTDIVADVTIDSEFVAGVSEVRGAVQGLARFGSPPGVLVPFVMEF